MTKFTPLIEEIHLPLTSIEIFELLKSNPYPFFLDSGMDKNKLGRFSFLGSNPFLVFESKKSEVQLIEGNKRKTLQDNPFNVLKDLLNKYKVPRNKIDFPFIGGAVGYFAYDLCHHIEKLPQTACDDINIPDCILGFYDSVIIIDHLLDKTYITSLGFPETDEASLVKRQKIRLEELKKKLFSKKHDYKIETNRSAELNLKSNFSKSTYIDAIEKAKEYIAKGDIYQVNLSQRFSSKLPIHPFELYKRLRYINPAPFAAYLDFGELKIVSASPERYLCLRKNIIHTRPIKGTRPRGANYIEDNTLMKELLDSPKDRAEHLMIVDLERNDLGRVSKFGSVKPTEFITLEKYSTVFHLVSTISGILKDDLGAVDCILNCFPGGSITGAPKIRSMEIIDELEPTQRAVYTGAIGYISFTGDMDTSIVIRTIITKNDDLYFQVGGGIVADSDPEAEYQETLDKAKALVEALYCNENIYKRKNKSKIESEAIHI